MEGTAGAFTERLVAELPRERGDDPAMARLSL